MNVIFLRETESPREKIWVLLWIEMKRRLEGARLILSIVIQKEILLFLNCMLYIIKKMNYEYIFIDIRKLHYF